MVIFKKKQKITTNNKEITNKQPKALKNETEFKIDDVKIETIENQKKEEEKKVSKPSIKKGSKVIANGRCFGAPTLQCPLKAVRNYESKILEVDKENNVVLIDEGWISLNNIK